MNLIQSSKWLLLYFTYITIPDYRKTKQNKRLEPKLEPKEMSISNLY